jgi:hypothetical protein
MGIAWPLPGGTGIAMGSLVAARRMLAGGPLIDGIGIAGGDPPGVGIVGDVDGICTLTCPG